MKYIITTILLLFFSVNLFSQERKLIKLNKNLYEYKVYDNDGNLEQRGFYKKENDIFLKHGLWRSQLGTKALFDEGDLIWIKLKGEKKYYWKEIQFEKLKRKVQRLEKIIVSIDKDLN